MFIYSSNLGALRMALQIGVNRQRDFLDRVGFLKPSPIELPEISHPLIPKPWREINAMTIALRARHHGLAHAVGGRGPRRSSTAASRARPRSLPAPPAARVPGERVMSAQASAQLNQLMRLNVERGSGKTAEVAGYFVGGKTGTAEKIVHGGYKKNARISSFLASFPAHAPNYVLLVMIDEPQGKRETGGYATGGVVAAPAGRPHHRARRPDPRRAADDRCPTRHHAAAAGRGNRAVGGK